jgi:hypothetical protein
MCVVRDYDRDGFALYYSDRGRDGVPIQWEADGCVMEHTQRGCCEEKQFGNEPTGKTCSISKHLSSRCPLMPGCD